MHLPLAFLGNLEGPDLLIIAGIALLIFGKRLPEIGKNLGKTIVEFKKGLNAKPEDDETFEQDRTARQRLTATTARPGSLPQTEEV